MSVKVRCPSCEKVLNAPDAARGKAVKCPKCQTKIKVPGEKPQKAVAKASAPDSTAFLINLKASELEDRKSRICPKCGADAGDEDVDCPECGVNLETGVMSERTRQRRSQPAVDANKFFKEMVRDSFRFWMANKSLGLRTAIYLCITSVLSIGCLVMFMWCSNLPPKAFWLLLAFVAGIVAPGWVLYLQLQIVRNTYERKKKTRPIKFEFFTSAALGVRLLLWTTYALAHFGLTIGAIGGLLIMFDMSRAGYIVLGLACVPVLLLAPIAFSHMIMPIQKPAWKIPTLLGAFFRTWKGVLFWFLFLILTNIPAVAGVVALGVLYRDDVAAVNTAITNNHAVAVRRSGVQIKENQLVQSASVQNQLAAAGTEQDVPWSNLLIPIAGWLACCSVFAFTSVFNMRSNGLYTLYFRHDLGLITQAKETVYVSRSEDMFVEERDSTVSTVWAIYVLAILGCVALSFTLGSIIWTLVAIVAVTVLIVPLAGLWRIFEKAGEPGWRAFTPKIILKWAGYQEWYWSLLLFVPGYGQYLWCKAWIALAQRFQRGSGFGVGLAFAPIIFHPLLGFSSTRCLRPEYVKQASGVDAGGGGSQWIVAAYVLGGVGVLIVMAVLVIGLLPPSVVGLVTGGEKVDPPKNYIPFRPYFGQFACKSPEGWDVRFGGGKDDVPQWAEFTKGGVLIKIQDSASGTPGTATVNKALGVGNEVQQGTAEIRKVHEYYTPILSDSMRNYKEEKAEEVPHEMAMLVVAEFSAEPLFGPGIRGLHGTMLMDSHQYTITCRCSESQFTALKPAFMKVIDTITPWPLYEERFGPVQ